MQLLFANGVGKRVVGVFSRDNRDNRDGRDKTGFFRSPAGLFLLRHYGRNSFFAFPKAARPIRLRQGYGGTSRALALGYDCWRTSMRLKEFCSPSPMTGLFCGRTFMCASRNFALFRSGGAVSIIYEKASGLLLSVAVLFQIDFAVMEQAVAEIHGGGLALLGYALPLDDLHGGLEYD